MEINIRPALVKDIGSILNVISNSYLSFETNKNNELCIPRYDYEEIEVLINNKENEIWVAEYSGLIIGVAAGIVCKPNTFHLKLLFVASDFQQSGVGKILLDTFEYAGMKRGYDLLTTNFLSWAKWSGNFYKKHGYKEYTAGDETYSQELMEQVRWRQKAGLLNNKEKCFVWKTVKYATNHILK